MEPRSARSVLLGALCALLVAVPAGAGAAPPDAVNQGRFDKTVAYLQRVQNLDGGFPGRPGGASDSGFSAWVAYALAAASINPQDQRKPGGVDVHTYLLGTASALRDTTDFGRALLVAIAAGTDPRDFAGIDLVATIVGRQLPDGSFPQDAGGIAGQVNSTAFAVLPLSQIGDPALAEPIGRAVAFLRRSQRADGAWGWQPDGGYSTDMTGAVIQALNAAGRHGSAEERRALAFLRTMQNDDGGFAELNPGAPTNAMSTAWAVQALWSAGVDPRAWRRRGGDPLDAMAAFQNPDGSVRYLADADANLVWSTAQVAPALAGRPLPIPTVPRRAADPQEQAPAPVDPAPDGSGTGGGAGGFERTPGGGVIAGGGGNGAPLFSRPQAQSKGTTPGGVRRVAVGREEEPRTAGRHRPSAARSNGSAAAGVTPVRSRARRPGGANRHPAGARRAGGQRGDAVTGRLVGRVPAGTGGEHATDAAAPGLRGAATGGEEGPGTAIAIGGALLLAMIAGIAQEARGARPRLLAGWS
jgi:hypothetical protein